MAEPKKKLSVAEMLAAARKDGAKPSASAEPAEKKPEEAASAETPVVSEPAAETPAAEKPAAAKPAAKPAGGKMSMAEMLAAARSGTGPKPAEKAAEAPKPAPKPAAEKPAVKEKPAAKAEAPAGPVEKDSASFLSGGPKKDRAGPMSKAEAAAKAKDEPEAKPAKVKPPAPPMPPKPEYAKPKPAAPVDQGRRSALVFIGASMALLVNSFMALGFSAMSATFSLWGLALARFMFPNVLREPPSQFKVGFKPDFPFGKVEEKFKAQFGVWVVHYEYNGASQIYALSTVCTHLGCTPNWLESEQKFKCPCHGSGFYKDGINFEGPAPRPLERYVIRYADDGQIEVDKSRKFQEEMGQWEDSASFLTG